MRFHVGNSIDVFRKAIETVAAPQPVVKPLPRWIYPEPGRAIGMVVVLQQSDDFVSHKKISDKFWVPGTNVVTPLRNNGFLVIRVNHFLNHIKIWLRKELDLVVVVSSTQNNFDNTIVDESVDLMLQIYLMNPFKCDSAINIYFGFICGKKQILG